MATMALAPRWCAVNSAPMAMDWSIRPKVWPVKSASSWWSSAASAAAQMVAIAFLLAGPAGDQIFPYVTELGILFLWIAALITLYTGYDYFRAGLRHIDV